MSSTEDSRDIGRWRVPTTIAVALLVVGVALALPSPQPAPPFAPTPTGPLRVTDVWPSAKPIPVAALLPDLSSFQPLLVLDGLTMLGVATSPDLTGFKLVIRSANGGTRQLRSWTGQQTSMVAAATVDKDSVFWLERASDDDGDLVTAWRARLSGGQAEQLASERSDLLYYDSGYDLQVVGGALVWAVLDDEGGSEIHSLPIGGGAKAIRTLDGRYALSAWPWVSTSSGGVAGDVNLLNLTTNERRTVAAGPNEILACTPSWCRITTLVSQQRAVTYEVERPDGSQRTKIGNTSLTPINNDVALLDRFEVLTSPAPNDTSYGQNLWLLDLTTGRQVLLEEAAITTTGSRGPFLWWSTGDNETVVWHILDLRQLS